VAVIANALDAAPAEIRSHGVQDELGALGQLGLAVEELDLRDYFVGRPPLADTLARYQLVWLRGGNVFVLRAALDQSGADHLLVELLHRDALVWAGYSAGCCVLAPSLRGLELMVDPGAVQACYGLEPIWEGLGLLTYAIVPHYRSQHPQSEAAARLVARYRAERVAHQHYATAKPSSSMPDHQHWTSTRCSAERGRGQHAGVSLRHVRAGELRREELLYELKGGLRVAARGLNVALRSMDLDSAAIDTSRSPIITSPG
jgi:dipeptidase E